MKSAGLAAILSFFVSGPGVAVVSGSWKSGISCCWRALLAP